MTDWMYAHNLPIDMHPEGCECGCRTLTESEYEQELREFYQRDLEEELRRDMRRDERLAEILGVDIDTVIAALPDDDIVPDELWRAALAQVKAEGL